MFGQKPTVCVVITTTGRQSLGAAIESVYNQTYRPDDLIIVDDSVMAEVELVAEHLIRRDPMITLIRTHAQGGGAARNLGIERSSADLTALLDDDDIWRSDKLELQVAEYQALTNSAGAIPVLVSCQMYDESTDRNQPQTVLANTAIARWLFCRTWSLRRWDTAIQTSSMLFNTEVRSSVQFDESLKSHQDWDWVIKFDSLPNRRISILPIPLYTYTKSAGAKVSSGVHLEDEQRWALRALGRGSPELFGYFATVGLRRALHSNNPEQARRAISRGFRYGKIHLPSLVAAVAYVGLWVFGMCSSRIKKALA